MEAGTRNEKHDAIEKANVMRAALNAEDKRWAGFIKSYLAPKKKAGKQEIILSDRKIWFLNSLLRGF